MRRPSRLRPSLLAPLSALALAGAGTAAPSAPPGRVSLDGAGGVRPGMTVPQVQSRWGVKLRLSSSVGGRQCESAAVHAGATRGFVIFRNGRFRAVFFKQGATTGKGIRIGSTVAALRRAYGSGLTSTPDKYTLRARNYYLTRTARPRWKLRFDVSPRGRVTLIAFGDEHARLVEGCE